MAGTGSILDYATIPERVTFPWQAIVAAPMLLFTPMTMCMCGHMDWFSFPFTLGAASLSWWGFSRKGRWNIWRVVAMVMVVFASLAFTKNVADVLWFGHEPLMRRVG